MFAVIYRWRVRPDREEAFVEGWRRVSGAVRDRFGSYGSRLHRSEDGLFVSYGRWPDREAREPYRQHLDVDPEGFRLMQEAIVEELPEIRLSILGDLLDEPDYFGRTRR
ncbi:MAG TPA: antibiotic biosynthesis monooxygenase [Candidatus Dormibacteraeota bacterium]